jgi:hypothetical protein
VAHLTQYDLREFQALPQVRLRTGFRIGLPFVVVAVAALAVYLGYLDFAVRPEPSVGLFTTVLLVLICGMVLWMNVSMRAGATSLTIDESGLRLAFARGPPDLRPWDNPKFLIRGRRTAGVPGKKGASVPLWSVFGPQGGLSESFIPSGAFEEIVRVSEARGYTLREVRSAQGWVLYRISI